MFQQVFDKNVTFLHTFKQLETLETNLEKIKTSFLTFFPFDLLRNFRIDKAKKKVFMKDCLNFRAQKHTEELHQLCCYRLSLVRYKSRDSFFKALKLFQSRLFLPRNALDKTRELNKNFLKMVTSLGFL